MANLSDIKISDSFGRLLQVDPTTTELQNLQGANPGTVIFNGTVLRYVDGNQQSGYVMKSDASGNSSWGALTADIYLSAATLNGTTLELNTTSGSTISVQLESLSGDNSFVTATTFSSPTLTLERNDGLSDLTVDLSSLSDNVYWSANTDGSITPSGLTTTIQTEGDLRVSGTVYTNNITTTATSTDTLSIQSNSVEILSHGGSVEYLEIRDDMFKFYLDGDEAFTFTKATDQYLFNAGGQDYKFVVAGPTSYNSLQIFPSSLRIRMLRHIMIGDSVEIPNTIGDEYGLVVTGSSLFYSGGTSISTNAISAVGAISATTNLHSNYIVAKTPMIQLNTTDNTSDIYSATALHLPWDKQEIIDSDYFTHDTVTDNHKIFVDYDGRYEVSFTIVYNGASSADIRATPQVRINKNGSSVGYASNFGYLRRTGGCDNSSTMGTYVVECNANDYITISSMYQSGWGANTSNPLEMVRFDSTVGYTKVTIKKIG